MVPGLWKTVAIILFDLAITYGSFLLGFFLKFGSDIPAKNWSAFQTILVPLLASTVVTSLAFSTYKNLHRSVVDIGMSLSMVVLVNGLVAGAATYALGAKGFPRSVLIYGLIIQLVALFLWKAFLAYRYRRRYFGGRVAIVSAGKDEAERLFERGLTHVLRAPAVVLIDEFQNDPRVLFGCNLVFVTSDLDSVQRRHVTEWCAIHGVDVLIVPDIDDLRVRHAFFTRIGDIPMVQLRRYELPTEAQVVKRIVDLVVSVLLALVFLPVWIVVPVLIKVFSPGPVFYSQERVGKGGVTFRVHKFRTMVVDAEKYTGPVLAEENDPRITPIGRWLRATRLDELPQLWNVIMGEMSLIGPRPERPVFVEQFAKEHPGYHLRHTVKPGLTGLAQVFGRYDTDPVDKLRYDMMYITHYSLLMDLQILFWTVQAVLVPQSWVEKQARRMARYEVKLSSNKYPVHELAASSEMDSR